MKKKKLTPEKIILVDKNDKKIGVEEKLKAHLGGKLHRAFSVFIFNSQKELMLQKRAKKKYHNGGLWSNTCCSHPRPNESLKKEARRRLKEEMGIDCPNLKKTFSFVYKVEFNNGLIEYEYDYVFTGQHEDDPILNLAEAEDWKWINLAKLQKDINKNPDNYTYWLKILGLMRIILSSLGCRFPRPSVFEVVM